MGKIQLNIQLPPYAEHKAASFHSKEQTASAEGTPKQEVGKTSESEKVGNEVPETSEATRTERGNPVTIVVGGDPDRV